jgi:hypothetical protein
VKIVLVFALFLLSSASALAYDCYANSWLYYNVAEAEAAGQCFTDVGAACQALTASRNAYYPSSPMTYHHFTGLNCQTSSGAVIGVVLAYNHSYPPCPAGKEHKALASGGISSTCTTIGAPMCSAIGVSPTDLVSKCSGMIAGSPTVCVTGDYVDKPLSSCPSIDCGGGVTVQYPATCPIAKVTECPAGFTLSPMPNGDNTCVMPAPDKNNAPCVLAGGQTICASDENNCVRNGDKFTCLKLETTQPPGSTCYTAAGQLYCLSDQPQITTTKQQTTLPDGSTQVTETTKPSVKGAEPQTRTTTTAPNGTVTIKSTMSNDVTPLLAAYGQGQQQNIDLSQVNLNTANTAANTQAIKDSLAGLGTTHAAYNPSVPGESSLYEASGKTFGGSITKLKDGVLSSQIGQTVTNIFKLTIPASSCPTWTIPHTALTPEIVIDQQCAAVMDNHVWPVIRAVLYVVTLLIAFTWAFL